MKANWRQAITRIGIGLAIVLFAWALLYLVLALGGPVRVDSWLFGVQDAADQTWLGLQGRADDRLEFSLTLLERRRVDMEILTGSSGEMTALEGLNTALDRSVLQMAAIPREKFISYRQRLLNVLSQINRTVGALRVVPGQNPVAYEAFSAKLAYLRRLIETGPPTVESLLAVTGITLTEVPRFTTQGGLVGLGPFQHTERFPLLGAHADLECAACHADGRYTGRSSECLACHAVARPVEHYPGDCAACHTPEGGWTVSIFSHAAGLSECQSCHESYRPAAHYAGDCALCHTPSAWLPAAFDHKLAAAADCQSCHLSQRPAGHYAGQCSLCHTPGAWLPASFNHADATDCQSCHLNQRPAGHYTGTCSLCHTPAGWKPAFFNHVGALDCQACHASQRPAGHYSGQCSTCHSTTAWVPASFNHQGATDCLACHTSQRPAGHYTGQCSLCHSTTAWLPASFNHAGATDCQACHAAQAPANHYAYQCSMCHSTTAWVPANFSHTFPLNHKGANSNCALCHPATPPAYTCWGCHDQVKTEKKHADKGMTDITNCMQCHPDGKKPKGGALFASDGINWAFYRALIEAGW